MAKADSEEWFREAQFKRDVLMYLKRHGITDYETLGRLTDIRPKVMSDYLTGGSLTPRTMGALANLCDLDLNTYVLTQSQHDDYMDAKHQRRKTTAR